MDKLSLQNKCAANLQTLLPWIRFYLRGLLKQAPQGMLSIHEVRVLARVLRFPGLSLQCLADDLGINKATASGRVDQLVSHGLLERQINPQSRREVMLKITESGQIAYTEAKGYLKNHLASQMEQFSSDELKELERGISLLARMVSQAHPEISIKLSDFNV